MKVSYSVPGPVLAFSSHPPKRSDGTSVGSSGCFASCTRHHSSCANDPLGLVREDAARCSRLTGEQRAWLPQRAGELQGEYSEA